MACTHEEPKGKTIVPQGTRKPPHPEWRYESSCSELQWTAWGRLHRPTPVSSFRKIPNVGAASVPRHFGERKATVLSPSYHPHSCTHDTAHLDIVSSYRSCDAQLNAQKATRRRRPKQLGKIPASPWFVKWLWVVSRAPQHTHNPPLSYPTAFQTTAADDTNDSRKSVISGGR
ncbi:hypothetical protein BHE74_00050263 [Ensete ventricosum]|nr:hypothetical protein GW17_00049088 [Ensete ventricosum]RWW44013.1 hypothetical protein BHE74_00050263 [Ensete ventricosum]RZS22895.1 hypothetical protein BHM03_00055723 [Ensete ventricosum]